MEHKDNRHIWDKLEPADLIALIAMLTWSILSWKGVQVMISPAIFLIFGYYFGRRIQKNGWH